MSEASEYDLSLCIHCEQPYESHSEPTPQSAYLRYCQENSGIYCSRRKVRESERERRWKFVTEAAQLAFSGYVSEYNGFNGTVRGTSSIWDALVEEERRWLAAWRYRA